MRKSTVLAIIIVVVSVEEFAAIGTTQAIG